MMTALSHDLQVQTTTKGGIRLECLTCKRTLTSSPKLNADFLDLLMSASHHLKVEPKVGEGTEVHAISYYRFSVTLWQANCECGWLGKAESEAAVGAKARNHLTRSGASPW